MLRKLLAFLIAIHFNSISSIAQDKSCKPFYIELNIAPLLNFGAHGEIKGAYDSILHDMEHLKPAFKNSTAAGLVLGYVGKDWALRSTINYFRQDMTLVEATNWSTNGPKLATGNFISTKVSALLLMDLFKRQPFGWYSGIFIGTVSSFSYTVDPLAKETYGITDISNQTELNWGIETHLNFALGKKGVFGNVGTSLTMPGVKGGVGKIKLNSSGYTIVDDTITMYTMAFFVGVGFRFENCRQ